MLKQYCRRRIFTKCVNQWEFLQIIWKAVSLTPLGRWGNKKISTEHVWEAFWDWLSDSPIIYCVFKVFWELSHLVDVSHLPVVYCTASLVKLTWYIHCRHLVKTQLLLQIGIVLDTLIMDPTFLCIVTGAYLYWKRIFPIREIIDNGSLIWKTGPIFSVSRICKPFYVMLGHLPMSIRL